MVPYQNILIDLLAISMAMAVSIAIDAQLSHQPETKFLSKIPQPLSTKITPDLVDAKSTPLIPWTYTFSVLL